METHINNKDKSRAIKGQHTVKIFNHLQYYKNVQKINITMNENISYKSLNERRTKLKGKNNNWQNK